LAEDKKAGGGIIYGALFFKCRPNLFKRKFFLALPKKSNDTFKGW